MEKKQKNNVAAWIIIIIIVFMGIGYYADLEETNNIIQSPFFVEDDTFKIISSSENKDLEEVIMNYAKKENIKVSIDYTGTIDIMDKLNSGEKYDAVWTSNSIWLYMLNSNVSVKNSKSTSINPVVFGITKSKAQELGFVGKEVYTKDILEAINAGKLKFNMPAVTRNKYRSNSISWILNYSCRQS